MSLNTSHSALHLSLPQAGVSGSQSRTPSLISLHPSVLAQILEHHSRRSSTQPRAIGALLGLRHESGEVEVRNCFALPSVETESEVAVDMEYYRSMMELTGKVSAGREGVVGWYSSTSAITPYSALFQNFFAQECGPSHPAVHLTVDAEMEKAQEGQGLAVKTYIASAIGLTPKPENCVFLPVPCSVKYHLTERPALDLLTFQDKNASASLPPLATLSASLSQLSEQLAQVQEYVAAIESGSKPADPEIGRYLLDAVGRWKQEAAVTEGVEGEEAGEGGVKKGVQDYLSISYLSALLRSQVELSARLNLLAAA